jgi:hypothetical protein
LSHTPRLIPIVNFCSTSIDKWTEKQEKTKVEKTRYGISIEKFNWATNLYQVKQEDLREALQWVSIFSNAAEEAADMIMIENRKKAWGKNRRK